MTERTHTYNNGIERDTYRYHEIWVFRSQGHWAVMVRTGHNWMFRADGCATYIEAKRWGIAFIDNWFGAKNKSGGLNHGQV